MCVFLMGNLMIVPREVDGRAVGIVLLVDVGFCLKFGDYTHPAQHPEYLKTNPS